MKSTLRSQRQRGNSSGGIASFGSVETIDMSSYNRARLPSVNQAALRAAGASHSVVSTYGEKIIAIARELDHFTVNQLAIAAALDDLAWPTRKAYVRKILRYQIALDRLEPGRRVLCKDGYGYFWSER